MLFLLHTHIMSVCNPVFQLLHSSAAESTEEPVEDGVAAPPQEQAAVIPSAVEDSLIGDLLSMDLPSTSYNAPPATAGGTLQV